MISCLLDNQQYVLDDLAVERSLYAPLDDLGNPQAGFEQFVKDFWEEVPGAEPLQWNWHMSVLCQEMQEMAVRVFHRQPKKHDVIFNISPGTSKTTICLILFPAWVWTQMANARIMSASHTADLVLDSAAKSRHVVRSDKYQALWPIEFRDDQDAKGYYANTQGGDRYTCTVGGKSPMGFHAHFILVDDPIDPKKAVSEQELKNARFFFDAILPGRKIDKAVTPIFLIMQRLHEEDPSGHMLKKAMARAKREKGESKVKHYRIPAEIVGGDGADLTSIVEPQELAKNYINGLMDPGRLPRDELEDRKADGIYSYSGQYLQSPVPPGGGMFKLKFFNQREKAAPYVARRVRYWDKSATEDGGAATAGVLIAKDEDGNFWVEHVVRGQWEPDTRDKMIVAMAKRDRLKYGPKYEPTIYLEQEPGSGGVDSYKYTARKLAGFTVRPDKVSKSKELRAEPWSSQCAALNVWVVEDGSWDVQSWIDEHVHFPKAKFKDQVDASAGAFSKLMGGIQMAGLRSINLGRKHKGLKIVVCTPEEVPLLDHKYLRVDFTSPDNGVFGKEVQKGPDDNEIARFHLSALDLNPADCQDRWNEPFEPYGKLPEELVITRDIGKAFWLFLRKQREPQASAYIFTGEGDYPLSVAQSVCDQYGLPRKATIYMVNEDGDNDYAEVLNSHVFEVIKIARAMVL